MGRSFGTKSSSSLEGGKTMSMMNYLKLTSMIIKRKSLSLTGKQEIFTTFQVSNWRSFAKIVVGSVAFFLTHKNNNLGQIQSNPDYYVGSSKSAMHCLIYKAFHKVTNELLGKIIWFDAFIMKTPGRHHNEDVFIMVTPRCLHYEDTQCHLSEDEDVFIMRTPGIFIMKTLGILMIKTLGVFMMKPLGVSRIVKLTQYSVVDLTEKS